MRRFAKSYIKSSKKRYKKHPPIMCTYAHPWLAPQRNEQLLLHREAASTQERMAISRFEMFMKGRVRWFECGRARCDRCLR